MRKWEQWEKDFVLSHFNTMPTVEIAAKLSRTWQSIYRKARVLGLNVTNPDTSNRFKPGREPKVCFPIGATRISSTGYVDVKVSPGKNGAWKALHRENWKKEYGEYPPASMTVRFKDGNRHNCAVSNLYLISKREAMRKVSVNNMHPEIRDLIRLKGRLNYMINNRSKKNENSG